MSGKYASTFVQSAMNMSGYSTTQQEFCKIDLHGAGGSGDRTRGPLFPSGKKVFLKRSGGAKAAASSKRPRLGQREEILLRSQLALLALNPKPTFGFTSAADPVLLPEPERWALREHFVVPSIRSREVAPARRSRVRLCEDALKAFDFGNSLFKRSSLSSSKTKRDWSNGSSFVDDRM
jgi:hypothetical protein